MNNPLIFYFFLAVISVVIIILGLIMSLRTKSVGPAIGTFILYYWSIYGAWFFVHDQAAGRSDLQYEYLFIKMFPVKLDGVYFLSVWFYALFILLTQIGFLMWMKRPRTSIASGMEQPIIEVSHYRLIALFLASIAASYGIIYNEISQAFALGVPAHDFIWDSENIGLFFTFHQVLNRIALLALGVGVVILASGTDPNLISGKGSKYVVVVYLAGLFIMYYFCAMIGNKNEVLLSLVAMVILYLSNCRKPRYLAISGVAFFGLTAIAGINSIRTLPASDVSVPAMTGTLLTSIQDLTTNNEAFGAHFSMYGVLSYNVPLTYGSSLISLVASVIPRSIWSARPPEIYDHYANSIIAVPDQGYAIHHATGWYLNFGFIGMVCGALLLGIIWAHLTTRVNSTRHRGLWHKSLYVFGPCMMVACLPSIIRAGPEVYKGLVIIGILLPFLISWTCGVRLAAPRRLTIL